MSKKQSYNPTFGNVKIFGTLRYTAEKQHNLIKQIFSELPDSIKVKLFEIRIMETFGKGVHVNVVCGNGVHVSSNFNFKNDNRIDAKQAQLFRVNIARQAARVFKGHVNPANWARDEVPKHNGQYLNRPLAWSTLLNFVKAGDHNTTIPRSVWSEVFDVVRLNKESMYDSVETVIRDRYIERFAYPIVTTELVDALAETCKGKRVIDVGSGSGYIAYQLKSRGIDITAVDDNSHERKFVKNNTLEVIQKDFLEIDYSEYDVVILSWPEYNCNKAAQLLDKLSDKQNLIYCGEWWGGCTADMDFFNILTAQFEEIPELTKPLNVNGGQFRRLHDTWGVYHRTRGRHIVRRKGELYAIVGEEGENIHVQQLGEDFQPIPDGNETFVTAEFNKTESFWDF